MIYWFDSDHSRIARADNVEFRMRPVKLRNGRRLYHCSLSASEIIGQEVGRVRDLKGEWFISDDNRFIEIENHLPAQDWMYLFLGSMIL